MGEENGAFIKHPRIKTTNNYLTEWSWQSVYDVNLPYSTSVPGRPAQP